MSNNVIKLNFAKQNTEEKKETRYTQSPVSNPIYKTLLSFHHTNIGEKLSVQDILR
jgi:hypothetical protein